MTVPDPFWRTLASAPRALLALDYDGTLAPYRRERHLAVPYPGMRDLIGRLRDQGRTRVVVITGRPPQEAAALLGLEPPLEVWGSHGWERLRPDGVLDRQPLQPAIARVLAAAERAAEAGRWGEACERKHASLALHWRDEADAAGRAAAARALLAPLAERPGLALLEFAAGLELRASGWDKGRALSAVLAAEDPGPACAYLGDDQGDEDAFAVLAARPGLPLLVADRDRPTAATGRLAPPDELRSFLTRWLDVRRRSPS